MAQFKASNMAIRGIASCVPKTTVSNFDYHQLPEDERKLMIKTTGIEKRRVAPAGVTTADLCQEAAEKLIAELNWDKKDIGLLVFVTQSGDYIVPSIGPIMQHRLGLPKSTIAFDSGLGCSGYVYGLSMVSSYMNTAGIKKAILLAGDISTYVLTPTDKSAYPLFGDAGTATALEWDEKASPMYYSLGSDGAGYEAIIIPDGGMRTPFNPHSYDTFEVEGGIVRSRGNLWLNGMDVFTFSVTEVPESLKGLMDFAGVTPESIDYFYMHQANKLMNETIRKKLKFDSSKVFYSLHEYGNTSSASIPLTMSVTTHEQLNHLQEEKTFLLSGFGVGLSWASVIFRSKNIHCSALIEI